ncbi:uncharacterized protein LOC114529262 [Dendronephthya gigantea]|uniref:uncharacterized protein LOC114529262 n=1 Tax=Dendronephthya gigantea TaxID=151771 RepID=UPI00106D464A|nr:uncharacterized protein LOC114529262 [Dendronephthya gigantea]
MNVRRAIDFGLEKLGFLSIKNNQRKVVEAYLNKLDVLMVSPTGSGKSLTFQISPFALDYIKHGERTQQDDIQTVCLVIAPLVSLMKDQVAILREKQVKAVMIGPESTTEENEKAKKGQYNLVFASPEAVFKSHRSTILALKDNIAAVFIDEGHCIVKWGHGNNVEEAFRKDYSRLAELRSILKRNTPFIVLTATATQTVRNFIIKDLAMKDCVQLITIPNKNNIRFSVSEVDSNDLSKSFQWPIDELKTKKVNTQKVLIFCRKRSHVKDLYEAFLEALGQESYVLPTGQESIDDRTRLFAMYHKKTNHLVKTVVEREFCKFSGTV